MYLCLYSAGLDVNHRVCFRSLHAAEFQRQSQVAAAAAAAVAGFSAFNVHSSALGGAGRRYYVPHGHVSKSSGYRVSADDVAQFAAHRRSPTRYRQMSAGSRDDEVVVRRTYPE